MKLAPSRHALLWRLAFPAKHIRSVTDVGLPGCPLFFLSVSFHATIPAT
jgi:hypothetical protein